MSEPLGDTRNDRSGEYTLETDLEASPEKVWRALTEPALREAWLGEAGKVVEALPPEQLTLRCDEKASSGLVTFTVRPGGDGGSHLTIVHRREAEVVSLDARRASTLAWRMAA
jgi:uncharacterized protein YndB with AHSA1/START domain